jgi:hypothetical protein
MNIKLIDHIDAKIASAGNFVSKYMPVDISIDSAYEEMLACSTVFSEATKDDMINAFRESVKYLEPASNFKRFNFILFGGRVASIQARFQPTSKWPTFLIPAGNLSVDPESKFAALLDTPIRVATEWESLDFIWKQLRIPMYDLDVAQLTYLMPWIRECLADFDMFGINQDTSRIERRAIEKEMSTVMNDTPVLFFPRMSKALSAVARSGKVLFSQYRMIESAYSNDTLTVSPITVERTPSLIEPWLREHLAEALEEWQNDRAQRTARQLEAIMMRAAKKFDKTNPRGN